MALSAGRLQKQVQASTRCNVRPARMAAISKHRAAAAANRESLRIHCQASSSSSQVSTAVAETAAATSQSFVKPGSQLEQLAAMTVLSIDTGDIQTIQKFAATGLVTDATTNPLFVSQAAARGSEPEYAAMVDAAVAAACQGYSNTSAGLPAPVPPHASGSSPSTATIDLAIDCLSVELGKRILTLVPGYVSTEVDIRLSFDAAASEARARRIIDLYEAAGVPRSRVLIKLAGTWEGIQAAKALEKDGIKCNITLVFGVCQAVAAAQAGATLISPFPGRVLEWVKANGGPQSFTPQEDPGVIACRQMYAYFRRHGHNTICMPASWRSSTGTDMLDEIRALAGTDRMTIPPPLLTQLAEDTSPLPRVLQPGPDGTAAECKDSGEPLAEAAFRWALANDGAANDKLGAGLRAFAGDTARLVEVLTGHAGWQ